MRVPGVKCALILIVSQVLINNILSSKLLIFSYSSVLTYVLGVQKNRPTETVLLSIHNICFEGSAVAQW